MVLLIVVLVPEALVITRYVSVHLAGLGRVLLLLAPGSNPESPCLPVVS